MLKRYARILDTWSTLKHSCFRYYATNREDTGLIANYVIAFFFNLPNPSSFVLGLGVDSASYTNENQKFSGG
jgi:hypothetical protein